MYRVLFFFLIFFIGCETNPVAETESSSEVAQGSSESSGLEHANASSSSMPALSNSSSDSVGGSSNALSNASNSSSSETQTNSSSSNIAPQPVDDLLQDPTSNNKIFYPDTLTPDSLGLIQGALKSSGDCDDSFRFTCATTTDQQYQRNPTDVHIYYNMCHMYEDGMVELYDRKCNTLYCPYFYAPNIPLCSGTDTLVTEEDWYGCTQQSRCVPKPICQESTECLLPQPLPDNTEVDMVASIYDNAWVWTELDDDGHTSSPFTHNEFVMENYFDGTYTQPGKFLIDVRMQKIENMHHTIKSLGVRQKVVEVLLGEPEIYCEPTVASFDTEFQVRCAISDYNNSRYSTEYKSYSLDYNGDGIADTLVEHPRLHDIVKDEESNFFTFYYPYSETGTTIHPILTIIDDDNNVVHDTIEITMGNAPPEAQNAVIVGGLFKGNTVAATFQYFDALNDPEGTHLYQWTRDGSPIPGATQSAYSIVEADVGYTNLGVEIHAIATKGTLSAEKPTTVVAPYVADHFSFSDTRDSKNYEAVKVGTYYWMRQNIDHADIEHKCYGSDQAMCDQFGGLYSLTTAQTACPPGWSIPSRDQVKNLIQAINDINDDQTYSDAYYYMKSADLWEPTHNDSITHRGLDSWGLSIKPTGYNTTSFKELYTTFGMWLKHDPLKIDHALYIHSSANGEPEAMTSENAYLSVRCIQ